MKNLTVFLIFILVLSCNSKKSNKTDLKSEIEKTIKEKSLKNKITLDSFQIQVTEPKNEPFLFADVLIKFNNSNEYYITLSFENQYSDSIANIIQNSFGKTVFKNELESRVEIPENIAQKYFSTAGLDKLIVINKEQIVIDTIYRKNYEFYDASMESSYVATYESPNQLGDSIMVISINSSYYLNLTKVPEPHSDLVKKEKLLKSVQQHYDEIFSRNSMIYKSDTISILSFGKYAKPENYLYLYKNGNLTDSIINDYLAVYSLTGIPLGTENELTYIYEGFKPDTDLFWIGLIGIDLENWKFKIYERNRIKR
ncbi:hypothetical protein [Zunongwangia sp. HRR-M8]|uniref:hypothetical protein n=1 Tax=Zunongwangia sp. HRR-M8 TaxID=3015170 RepID=UPI0022DDFD52|nr:hypothetical protein [Zunongwangia sp. HRR-M8]WBL23797.1 hypothetical protein PBT89_07505 [Zunongwangia sp. HRR-M8]